MFGITFDSVPPGATSNGYENVIFGDGSELWFRYTGGSKYLAIGKTENKGTAIVIGGKGRYAGVKGGVTYEGGASRAGPEGISYRDYVVNIKK